jgi:hypothetical protein
MEYVRAHPTAATLISLFLVTAVLLAVFDPPFVRAPALTADGVETHTLDGQRIAAVSAAVTALWYFWPDLWAWARAKI